MKPLDRTCWLLTTLCTLFLLGTTVSAQTTGQIEGVVVDQANAALPGVTVAATSTSLQGAMVAVTDTDGSFHLPLLPPGTYTVRCSILGFTTVERDGIVVPLGRTVTLHVQMVQSAVHEALTVTGTPPAVDPTSTEVGANLTPGFFMTLPLPRDYASVALMAPGTTSDGSGIRTGPCG